MAFYVPRTMATMQTTKPQQMRAGTQMQNPMNATAQMPQQSNPMASMGNAMQLYNAGKGGMKAANAMGNFYDAMTMDSGVNSGGVTSSMYSPMAANANLLAGESAATAPADAAAATQTAAASQLMGAPVESTMLAAPETTAAPWMSGSSMMTADAADAALGSSMLNAGATEAAMAGGEGAAMLGGEAAAGAAAAEGGAAAGGAAAAEGAGALGAEAAGLGALGPIGILAGAGLLGTKLFGLW